MARVEPLGKLQYTTQGAKTANAIGLIILLRIITSKNEPKLVGHGQQLSRFLEDLILELSFGPELHRPHLDEPEVVDVLGTGRHRDGGHLEDKTCF